MASPEAMGDYYKGHPKPDDPSTWNGYQSFNDAKAAHVAVKGEAPTPDPVPGPPSPGAGMPAARLGDMTAHGGTIGPVVTGISAMVFIGNQPAACLGDQHICPMFSGPKPHVGGTIMKGSMTVLIGNKPAARLSDNTVCSPEPGAIAKGEPTVLIGDMGGGGGAPPEAPAPDTPAPPETPPPMTPAEQKTEAIRQQNQEAAQSGAAVCETCEDQQRQRNAYTRSTTGATPTQSAAPVDEFGIPAGPSESAGQSLSGNQSGAGSQSGSGNTPPPSEMG